MCLGIPGKVIEIRDEAGLGAPPQEVQLCCLDGTQVGEQRRVGVSNTRACLA